MKNLFLFCLLFQGLVQANAQKTVGLISNTGKAQQGYILFAPLFSQTTYLIDRTGKIVHTWKSAWLPGQSAYLLPDGSLLRAANDSSKHFSAGGGLIEKFDWEGNIKWSFAVSDKDQRQHHDICPLPNGNVLVLAWEKRSKEEAIAAGRDPKLSGDILWSEKITEFKPRGKNSAEVVWEWRVWDHLVQDFDATKLNFGNVAESPGAININYLASNTDDWLHFNSIAYNPDLNQIIVSNRNFSEIFIIDHSTTPKEAASQTGGKLNKGGSLLYRWGNPAAYNMGSVEDQKLFKQHNANWIEKGMKEQGKIMIFNNGLERSGGDYSSVEILALPLNTGGTYARKKGKPYLPDTAWWQYKSEAPSEFFSKNASGSQRLSNGNTLICEGAKGHFFEIDKDKNIVWSYVNPVKLVGTLKQGEVINQNQVFKCIFYPTTYAAFKGRVLKANKPIESAE